MIIPQAIKKMLPDTGVKYFERAYSMAIERNHSDSSAFKIAWGATKKKMRQTSDGVFVANSLDFVPQKLYRFSVEPTNEVLITNSEDGSIMVDAVLADTTPRKSDGKKFTLESLQAIADQINLSGSTLPDTEHMIANSVLKKTVGDIKDAYDRIKSQKGLFTSIKAAVRDGKLWIRAWLDKRYQKIVNKYKFLSIEATAKEDGNGFLVEPNYLGFTFTKNPQLVGAALAE